MGSGCRGDAATVTLGGKAFINQTSKEKAPMSLELAPEAESRLREYAEAEGISVSTLIDRHFPPIQPRRDPAARVRALLAQWQ
jgi:hypothetical protein